MLKIHATSIKSDSYSRFSPKNPRISVSYYINGVRLRDISTLIRGFSEKSVDKYLSAVFLRSAEKKTLEKIPRISKSANKKTAYKEDGLYFSA